MLPHSKLVDTRELNFMQYREGPPINFKWAG